MRSSLEFFTHSWNYWLFVEFYFNFYKWFIITLPACEILTAFLEKRLFFFVKSGVFEKVFKEEETLIFQICRRKRSCQVISCILMLCIFRIVIPARGFPCFSLALEFGSSNKLKNLYLMKLKITIRRGTLMKAYTRENPGIISYFVSP